MPAQPKTSDQEIVRAARKLVLRHGGEALSMKDVAAAVGVQAPSLYKRFPDRAALLDAVAETGLAELRDALAGADDAPTVRLALERMAHAYRDFAHRVPHIYSLLFAHRPGTQPLPSARATAGPVLARLVTWVGEHEALSAARLLTAFLHGFIAMELATAFRLGGDLDQSFGYALGTILDALAAKANRPRTDGAKAVR